jgi:hypothetical protein
MDGHIKRSLLLILSLVLTGFCCGCGRGVEKSPIFEGVDLISVLVGSTRADGIPALEASVSSVPEYSLKDCEVTLDVPESQRSNFVARVMADWSNTVARLGGTIATNVATSDLSHELKYETERKTGLFRLYTADLNDRKVKLVGIMLECPRGR